MPSSCKTFFGAAILAICASGCPDPAKSFSDFDKRVIDASAVVVGTACGGELPDVNGEFYLQLSPAIAPTALLQFIAVNTLDTTVNPAILNITLQPLCAQAGQCTLREPIGEPFAVMNIEVSDECLFDTPVTGMQVPGGANAISGADLIGNLQMLGSIVDDDTFCGIVNGEAVVGGTPIPVDGSNFGATRIVPGTTGSALPEGIFRCPEEPPADAGVPDATVLDAGVDAMLPDAMLPDAS